MNGKYEIGDYVLTNWKLVKTLGSGAFGTVYEAHRDEFGVLYKAAIKIITIPQSQTEISSVQSEGMTEEEVSDYFEGVVKEIVNECAFMSRVKGSTNIVGYEDHVVIPHQGVLGWDILIRMELLTPLIERVKSQPMTPVEVAKLGVDICKALEVCGKMGIIHRDVKPENIMISELGDYKLGDFGISRTLEKTQGGLSKKGTVSYMAPEVAKGEAYGASVDLYSLGIVLYRFLNNNRVPFLPEPPASITYQDRENAQNRRIAGEEMPMPRQADDELGRIVLKACAYEAKDRYASPSELKKDLESWLSKEGTENNPKGVAQDNNTCAEQAEAPQEETLTRRTEDLKEAEISERSKSPVRFSLKWKACCVAVLVLGILAVGLGVFLHKKGNEEISPEREKARKTTEAENEGEDLTEETNSAQDIPAEYVDYYENPELVAEGLYGNGTHAYFIMGEAKLGVPEKPLNAKEIYQKIEYIPEMFYGTYYLPGGKEAEESFADEVGYAKVPYEGSAEREYYKYNKLSILPYQMKVGIRNVSPEYAGLGNKYWAELLFKVEFKVDGGYLCKLPCTYTIEGNKIKFQELAEYHYDKEQKKVTYRMSEYFYEYEFSFDGSLLTLSKDGKSVTLEGAKGTSEELEHDYMVDANRSEGSAMIAGEIDAIHLYDMRGKRESGSLYLYKDKEGWKDIKNAIADVSSDGLITITYEWDEEMKTVQLLYFYNAWDGMILTDGENIYQYQKK